MLWKWSVAVSVLEITTRLFVDEQIAMTHATV
nr:MAG TPA: hypothetical protein [Caudoviricetes sp.]DAR21227.1 MAG TPA: hypothetical protein [Caudoviricetes sp.]